MTGNADGLRTLEKYSRIPSSSIRYVPNADADIVHSIQNGILFLVAFWSGPALTAFSKLTQILHEMNMDDLDVVAVDVDGSPDVYQLPEIRALFGGVVTAPMGKGEVAFCRDGRVVQAAIISDSYDTNQYTVNAREFLKTQIQK